MIILCIVLDFFFAFGNGVINPLYVAGCVIGLLSLKYKPCRLVYFLFCSLQAVLLTLRVVGRCYMYTWAMAAGIVLLICFKVITSYKFYAKES